MPEWGQERKKEGLKEGRREKGKECYTGFAAFNLMFRLLVTTLLTYIRIEFFSHSM